MGVNQQILEIVKNKGPVLPAQVSKEINDSLLMTSARLSELLSSKEILVSNVKVGGSPLYYFSGQEPKLQDFSSHLKGVEKQAFSLLQEHGVLSDSEQEPAIRVALRHIKDFAVPLEVSFNSEKKIFWKWYLLSSDEVQLKIKEILSGKKPEHEEPEAEAAVAETPTQEAQPQNTIQANTEAIAVEQPVSSPSTEIKKQNTEVEKEQITPTIELTDEEKPVQTTLEKPKKQQTPKTVSFLKKVETYFSRKSIIIVSEEEIKKDSEYNYMIEIDSSIGKLRYFCKAKSKKKINDGDLSSALLQAQNKGFPLLYLSNGTVTKKTEEQLQKEFKTVVFRTI